MSKQGTRSKTKQGQANNKSSNSVTTKTSNGSVAKTPAASSATTIKAGGASNDAPVAKASTTAAGTAKAPATQPKQNTTGAKAPSNGAAKQAQPEFAGRQSGKSVKQQRKQQKIQNRLTQQRHDARLRRTTISLVAAAVVIAAGLIAYIIIGNMTSTQAHTVYNADYQPIDGVYCDQLEQTAYHHHVLLTIYIDGQQASVPAGVGIAGDPSSPTCYYYLHTHDTSGIVHIEAPNGVNYTLKDFLDIWQNFAGTSSSITYPSQLASSSGWTVYINGKKVNEDFSHVDISSNQAWHELITIMYNSPNAKPVTTYSWQPGL